MPKLWKPTAVLAAVSASIGLLTVLGSVTYGDVVRHHDWVDAGEVRQPRPGQYYIIADDGRIREPLCEIRNGDFVAPLPSHAESRRYVNSLGRIVPFVVDAVAILLPSLEAASGRGGSKRMSYVMEFEQLEYQYAPASILRGLTRWVLEPRDLQEVEKDGSAAALQDALRLSDCAGEIRASLASGFNVCQINEVIRDRAHGAPIAISFASLCLARPTDQEPRRLPVLDRGSFFSGLKHALDLVESEPLPGGPAAPRAVGAAAEDGA